MRVRRRTDSTGRPAAGRLRKPRERTSALRHRRRRRGASDTDLVGSRRYSLIDVSSALLKPHELAAKRRFTVERRRERLIRSLRATGSVHRCERSCLRVWLETQSLLIGRRGRTPPPRRRAVTQRPSRPITPGASLLLLDDPEWSKQCLPSPSGSSSACAGAEPSSSPHPAGDGTDDGPATRAGPRPISESWSASLGESVCS